MGPHVDTTKLPGEICRAVQAAGFPIETDLPRLGTVATTHPRFSSICETIFQKVIEGRQQGDPKKDPNVWTPAFIQTVKDYAAKHQLPVRMSVTKPQGLPSPLSTTGGAILLHILPPNEFTQKGLLYALDHEGGHLKDYRLITAELPDSKTFFEKETLTLPEFMVLIFAFLVVMEKKMTPEEAARFNALRTEAFHNFEGSTLAQASETYTLVTELFRWGEEIRRPGFKENTLNETTFARFRKNPSPPPPTQPAPHQFAADFALAAITASLQETGLWKQVTRRKDYDPEKIKRLDPRVIEFCRLAIRASSRYFPTK